MALTISDMLETIQNDMQDLKQTHNRVKDKTKVGHIKGELSNEIKRLAGIENRLVKVENNSCRNSSHLKAILGTVEKLSEKLEIFSIASKNRAKTIKPTELNGHTLKSETHSDQTGRNQAKEDTIISRKTSAIKESYEEGQGSCSKIKKDNVVPVKDSNDHLLNSGHPNSSGTKPSENSNPRITAINRGRQIENDTRKVDPAISKQEIKEKPKIIKCKSGFKQCRTNVDLDNRMCRNRKKRCFQGELLHPLMTTEEHQDHKEPTPNIIINTLKERNEKKETNVGASGKQMRMMTMAQMAERDFDSVQKVHSYEEWLQIATQSQREVAMKLVLSHGKISSRGHKYMLLLDTSESMKGEKFDIMIKAATSFVDVPLDILTLFIDDITICTGLHTVSLRYGIRDNVGLAHFGKDTKLIMHPLADYDGIKTEIANLRPGGPSPLAAGLLMALSGITHLGPTTIEHRDFLPYIIVITDGMPTRVDAPGEEDRESIGALSVSSLLTMLNLVRDSEIDKTVTNIALRGMKIFCVPVGGANTDIMSKVVKKTFGKLIPPDQIHRLAQNTQVLIHAAEIANKLEKNTEFTRTSVKTAVHSASLQELDAFDDITDNVMLLLDPVTQYHGRFKQPRCKAVQLGTRVRRGPNWQWKNQDSNMAGTVIGEDKDGMIWVEWDSGVKNCYHYDESQRLYDIKPVNEPRRLVDEMIAVGCKVKRGKDWKYDEQDGGRGSRGTILRVESNGKVVVHWDRGRLGTYKFACDDLFEVAVCDDGRTISSPDLIEDEQNSRQEMMPDLPLILPSHNNKMKPVQSTWQYQDPSGSWQSYEEETNVKLDRAYSRRPDGRCIVEINKTVHVVLFAKMIQENQTDHSSVPVQRLDNTTDLTETKQ
ncbi:Hypothetical predicted protein [Mytilus galloprovincialis]|uniref:MIB/HERC2 domain-containing protein n=1 Tax=Mytilus galloprovincialis TaxID=29158 RepID=A0A8B6CVI0_MYTGA|nr:Hypothetical predicted protein [Mytilus galloprovincialis]